MVVCALTSNVALGQSPGNVLLSKGEGNLPRSSVVNVTQLQTLDRDDLADKIGSLSPARIHEILAELALVLEPRM